MKEGRPEWYERARQGLNTPPLDPGMQREIERRIASGHTGKRRRYRLLAGTGAGAILLIFILVFMLQDSSQLGFPSKPTGGSAVTVVRAEGTAGKGRLLIIPRDGEKQDVLGAPSCMGAETDTTYQGAYDVVYEAGGKRSAVDTLPDLTFIQPAAGTLQLTKLQLPGADVFLLIPAYADCHGLTFYAYGVVSGSGEAFPLSFVTADGVSSDTSYLVPGSAPVVQDGRLILASSEGPGGETAEGPGNRIYKLDLSARALILEGGGAPGNERDSPVGVRPS